MCTFMDLLSVARVLCCLNYGVGLTVLFPSDLLILVKGLQESCELLLWRILSFSLQILNKLSELESSIHSDRIR